MRLDPADWGDRSAAKVELIFIGLDGRSTTVTLQINASETLVTDNATFESEFMPSVNSFANTIAAIFAAVSEANVDVRISFTNPYAVVNSNLGEFGTGDLTEVAVLNYYLQTDKTAKISIPAPIQGIMMTADGADMHKVNIANLLLAPLSQAISSPIDPATDASAWSISDMERAQATLGTNGLSHGKRNFRRFVPKYSI